MKKNRPAPIRATHKQEVRPSWSGSRSDVAPNGAKRVLFNPTYKDFAPTELCRGITKCGPRVTTCSNALNQANLKAVTNLTDQTSVNSVSLADVAKGGDGAKSAFC